MFRKLLLSLMAICAFNASAHSQQCVVEETPIVMPSFKEHFKYVKLGGALFSAPGLAFGPVVSLGSRFEEDGYALDISLSYAGRGNQYMVTLPKALYICHIDHQAARGFYVGGGASFGWINQGSRKRHFAGLLAEMSAGYDFNRFGKTKMFVEATLSQPLLPVTIKSGSFSFVPVFTIAYGIGF